MGQLRSLEYMPGSTDKPLSQLINGHFADLLAAGPRSGLMPEAGSAGMVTITAGYAITAEGLKISETTALGDKLAIPANASGNPRWDAIVLRHSYVTTPGGNAASYEIVQGTPAADPAYPTETIPSNAMVLGYALLQSGETNYERYAPTPRPHDNWKVVTVAGGGCAEPADYNGEKGLLQALEDLFDTGGLVLLKGVFSFTSTLEVPSGVELAGITSNTLISSSADPAIKLPGRTGTGTLGDGDNVLTDAGADFTQYSMRSLVWISGGGVSGLYPIAGRTETTLLLGGGSFGSQEVTYRVLNTSQLRKLTIYNTSAKDCVRWEETFMALLEGCVLKTSGDGLVTKAADMQWNSHIHYNHFFCGSNAVFIGLCEGLVVENNFADGQDIVFENYICSALVRGNHGANVVLPTIPDGETLKVGDTTFPFSEQHSPDGKHTIGTEDLEDGAVTQPKLATRLSGCYYASTDHTIAAYGGSGAYQETRVQFSGKKWEEPGDQRVTIGASWKFKAERAMKLRISATIQVEGWGAGSPGRLRLLVRTGLDGGVHGQYAVLDGYHIGYDVGEPVSYLQLPFLSGSVLIDLDKDDVFYVVVENNSETTATIKGNDGDLMQSFICFEEV